MHARLCPDCPVAEGLVNPELSAPDPPRDAADADAREGRSRRCGKREVEGDVKKITSLVYSSRCESYQRAIVAKLEEDKWRLMKTAPELLSFVKRVEDAKVKERGSKQSAIAKARRATSSTQRLDYEDGSAHVARGQRLSDAEKAIAASFAPISVAIERLKDGLKPTYSSLVEKRQLDEVAGDDDESPSPTIAGVA